MKFKLIPRSLQARLLWASFILLPLVIAAAAVALQRSFYDSLVTSEQSQAQLQVYLILSAVELVDHQPVLPELLPEPGFMRPDSGVYGYMSNPNGEVLWRSLSAQFLANEIAEKSLKGRYPDPGQMHFRYLRQQGYFLMQYPVVWESPEGDLDFMVSVLRSDLSVGEQMLAFKTRLWGWLSGVFLLALFVQYVIMRWGLKPLHQLADDLNRIEKGEAEGLTGVYPLEVQAVTDNLNQLIKSERQQRERYRNTLADLAHSLKTPLAVIAGASNEKLDNQAYKQLIDEQAQRMGQIVQYQLSRSVKSQSRLLVKPIKISPVVQRIGGVLLKVYAEKQIQFENQVSEAAEFQGDESDLMELLGNLMENACKYGKRRVRVTSYTTRNGVLLMIEDDGNGILPEESRVILERGKRMDTSTSGQGIGLAVTVDILSSYGGALEADNSPELGGARFRMMIPLA